MIADDIAGLLATTPAADTGIPDIGLHQCEVLAWNPATGQSTILLAGTPVSDLPMLNIGDTTNLAVGDTVVVVRSKSAMFILGRIVNANTGLFASSAVAFASAFNMTENYAPTTIETIGAQVTIDVPPWANKALVISDATCTGVNSRVSNDAIYASIWVDSNPGLQTVQDVAPSAVGSVSTADSSHLSVTPGGTITVTGRTRTALGSWATNVLNRTALSVSTIFTRIP